MALDEERPNLLITLDFGPGGRHLVLSGHMDTKPLGDAEWSVDPFAAELDGDRLYGLGSADMKSALAAMLTAAAGLELAAGRLTLLFTADEEDGAAFGARHVAETVDLAADGVVIGEPGGIEADFDRLHLVSRGIARLRLVATGRQGHSSLADELDDAERRRRRRPRGRRRRGHAGDRGPRRRARAWRAGAPPSTPAWRSAAGWASACCRIASRSTPRCGCSRAWSAARSQAAFDRAARRRRRVGRAADRLAAGHMVEPGDPLAAAAAAACRTVLGREPVAVRVPGHHRRDVLPTGPTLPALGPGLLRRAHAADEWVSADAVRRSAALYAELAREFCA